MALSPENQSALLDLSRFGRRRREICLSEVFGEFNETKELRLFEEHFTRDEVASLLDGLLALVRSTLGRELKATFASCLLLTKQTLEQAQAGGGQIGFDVARAQDKALLREVEEWETKVAGGAVMQLLIKAGGSAPKALNSVGVAQDAATLMVCASTSARTAPHRAGTRSAHAPPNGRLFSVRSSARCRSSTPRRKTRRRSSKSSKSCRCSAQAFSRRRARLPRASRDSKRSAPHSPAPPRRPPSRRLRSRDCLLYTSPSPRD